MPVAPRPTDRARRTRVLALGAAATAAALLVAGCTRSEEAPEPLNIRVVGAAFPDAFESGVLEVLGENLDTSYSTAMLDDGSFLVPGSSDGIVDDSVGILDPTTGEVDWVVTADVAEGSYVIPGDATERWVTWSVESDEGLAAGIPFVLAFDRETEETHVLADGTGAGGFAPGTTGGRVLVVGDLAVWEGALPLDASGGDAASDEASEPDATDGDEPFADGAPVTSAVFARPLDANSDVVTVAGEGSALVRDDCLEGSPVTAQVTTDAGTERRVVTGDGALGAVLAPLEGDDGEEVSLRCGAGGVVETYSEDGGVAARVVLRGGDRDIVLEGDGVADLQVMGMTSEWAAVWVGDLETALGQQLVVHRPSGKVFSLGESESQLLFVRPGVVAFGGPVDLAPLGEEWLEDLGEAGDDGFSGGALTTVGRLVAPKG